MFTSVMCIPDKCYSDFEVHVRARFFFQVQFGTLSDYFNALWKTAGILNTPTCDANTLCAFFFYYFVQNGNTVSFAC